MKLITQIDRDCTIAGKEIQDNSGFNKSGWLYRGILIGTQAFCVKGKLLAFIFRTLFLVCLGMTAYNENAISQPIPSKDENIPFLVTFGSNSLTEWGDDDFCQIFFFVYPQSQTEPVYLRIFDPDIGGKSDEMRGTADTKVRFSVYGGQGTYSNDDIKNKEPVNGYNGGNLLATKVFGEDPKYDGKWYTMGPFNPTEGELKPNLGGYIIKIIAEGVSGDDGNLYKYFFSTIPDGNKPLEGGNAFTYEYTFRLNPDPGIMSHIYPFVDNQVISVKQYNFDFDNDCYIRIVSRAKKGLKVPMSNEGNWVTSQHGIDDAERNSSLDIQMIKTGTRSNNNVVFYITNQYGKFLPFYSVPIGGVPKYVFNINAEKISKKTTKN